MVRKSKLTAQEKLERRIGNCTRCHLCRNRDNIVVGRGKMNPDVCFIGEAPGQGENVIGKPFVGPSGKLLDAMIFDGISLAAREHGIKIEELTPSYYITNTVLCRPCDGKRSPNRVPSPTEVVSCLENVMCIISIVNPKIICFVGKVSEKYLSKALRHYDQFGIYHPSFLLRQGGKQSINYLPTVRELSKIFIHIRRLNHG